MKADSMQSCRVAFVCFFNEYLLDQNMPFLADLALLGYQVCKRQPLAHSGLGMLAETPDYLLDSHGKAVGIFFLVKASGNSTSVVCNIFINSVLKQHYHDGSQTARGWLKPARLYFSYLFSSRYLHIIVSLPLCLYLCVTNRPFYTHAYKASTESFP